MSISVSRDLVPIAPFDFELALETEDLTKRFGDRVVVDHLSMKIPSAKVAAFVGPNGAGKTTTLRMLLGLVYPTSGSARVLNGSINDPKSYLEKVGALIEGPAFYPALSGRSNLEVLRALGGLPEHRIPQALELVGLEKRAEDRVGTYSLGMKQRLGLAAALLPEPSLLVVDEPGNGLDPTGITAVRKLLRKIADEGVTVLVSSHQLSELQQIADWVVVINQGKLKYQGPLEQLLQRGGEVAVETETPADNRRLEEVLRNAGYEVRTKDSGHLIVSLSGRSASDINRLAIENGITLAGLQTSHSTLEDVYFKMTDGGSVV